MIINNIEADSVLPHKYYGLAWLLFQARHALFQVRTNELSKYGVTPMQATVLFVIRSIGDKATPAEISRWLFREPHSVSRLITRMERDGLVRKVKDLGRKNMVRIVPTEKAESLYYESAEGKSFKRILSCLSEEEAQQLKTYLERLTGRALEELGVNHKPFLSV